MKPLILLGALPLLAAAQTPSPSTAPNPFDGAWVVHIDCPSNTEDSGAKGYRYDFPATVTGGVVSGEHGTADSVGWLRIDGTIPPGGGDTTLHARGRTATPDYAVHRPSPGTPYTYMIKAHFNADTGTGERVEARVCHFRFKR